MLVYAVGGAHPLAGPARALVDAIRVGRLSATTTVEVIQELVHVRGRRRPRDDAARFGRDFIGLLSPLLRPTESELEDALDLYERHDRIGSFDAVLVATARARGARALVSADRALRGVGGLRVVDLADADPVELGSR